ncbi:MAG: hypothetical protein HY343_05015 [Lentisphaerae bacterium]|nr:hypothetical protein [Lentisphaerota bacterium]
MPTVYPLSNDVQVRPVFRVAAGFMALLAATVAVILCRPWTMSAFWGIIELVGAFVFGSIAFFGRVPKVFVKFGNGNKKKSWSQDSGSPVHQYIYLMLSMAILDNVDKIVFGEPPRPYEIEIPEEHALPKQAAVEIEDLDKMLVPFGFTPKGNGITRFRSERVS